MGRARLSGPSPQIRLPWGGGTGRGTGLSQQLRGLEESRETGGHGGNTLPLPGHDNTNRNTIGKKRPFPLNGTCRGQALC